MEDIYFFAGLGFVVGIYALGYGFKMYRRYQLIRDTPTATVQSLPVGTVEVKGTVKQQQQENLYRHPLTDADCTYYHRTVEEYESDDDGGDWDTILTEEVGETLYIDDDTGTVCVMIENPDMHLNGDGRQTETMVLKPNEDAPRALDGISALDDSRLVPDFLEGERYRVRVESIQVGMDMYVFGNARTKDGDGRAVTNEDNIVVGSPTEAGSNNTSSLPLLGSSKPFIISNQDEANLIRKRKWLGPASFFVGLAVSAASLVKLLELLGL